MFNSLKIGISLAALSLSLIAQAAETKDLCQDNLTGCGLVFTVNPPMPTLSTANCTNGARNTYTLTNQGTTSPVINFSLTEIDSLADPNAVRLDGGTSCTNGSNLSAGSSCDFVIDFQPCVAGSLDWNLTVTPLSPQRPLVLSLQTEVIVPVAYVVNSDSLSPSISSCIFNNDFTFGSGSNPSNACTPVTLTFSGSDALNVPWTMLMNPAKTFAYITNSGGGSGTNISICPIIDNVTFGSVANPCVNSTGNGTINTPKGMTMNAAGTMLYIANNPGTISICPINGNGSLGPCSSVPAGSASQGIVLNEQASLAYVSNNTNPGNVGIFSVDGSGDLTFLSNFTDPSFNNSAGITMETQGQTAFVTNSGSNTVSFCPINGNSFDGCTIFDGGGFFSSPTGISILNAGYVANLVPISSVYSVAFCRGDVLFCSALTDSSFNAPSDVFILQ